MEDGDLFIAFPHQIHYYLDDPIPQEHYLLIMSPDICPEFKYEFKNYLPVSPVFKGAANNHKIVQAFENIIEAYTTRTKYSELTIKGALLLLFSELFENMPMEKKQTPNTNLLTDVIRFCYDNYTEDISLHTLSDALHISHSYVSRIFNERLQISFRDYINSLRIGKACEMIKESDKSITQISYEVGYNSPRTFNRCFIKMVGSPPNEYREKMALLRSNPKP